MSEDERKLIQEIRDRVARMEEAQKSEAQERKHVDARVETLENTMWGPNRDNGLVASVQGMAVKVSLATGIVMLVGGHLLQKIWP